MLQKLEQLFARTRRQKPLDRMRTIHLFLCVLIIGLHLFFLSAGTMNRIEQIFLDTFFVQRPALETHPAIVLIEIDERSIQAIGSWPWPWHYHAQMTHILNEWGAKTIVFDLPFKDSKTAYESVAMEEILQKVQQVYFPILLEPKTGKTIWVHSLPVVLEPEGGQKAWRHPIPEVESNAKGVGHVNVELDSDGVLRRIQPYLAYGEEVYGHLALKVAYDYLEAELPSPYETNLPVDKNRRFLVNWAGKWKDTFQHYSYSDVIRSFHSVAQGLEPVISPEEMKDKIVLIGVTAQGYGNANVIPIESNYPNLGIHANVLNNILMKQYVAAVPFLWNAICLIMIGVVATALFVLLRNVPSFIGGFALGFFWILAAFFLFWIKGVWFVVLLPLLLILILFIFSAIYDHMVGTREKLQLYDLATRDGLTGLFVIRHFRDILNQVVKETQRKKGPLSLILIDIDDFKLINDTYGHQAGDRVLKKTAELIYSCFRTKRPIHEADFVARYGGEEFIVMLRDAKLADAAGKVGERIRKRVEAETFIWEGKVISVRISLGVATLHEAEMVPDFMVRRADEALYAAKRAGKNRVCTESESQTQG